MGSKWSSRSSDSSPSWSSPTPRYAAGAFRGLDRHTKSQPSYEHRTQHQHQTVCNWLSIQTKAAPVISLLLRDYAYPCATWNISPKFGDKNHPTRSSKLWTVMQQHQAKASMKDKYHCLQWPRKDSQSEVSISQSPGEHFYLESVNSWEAHVLVCYGAVAGQRQEIGLSKD